MEQTDLREPPGPQDNWDRLANLDLQVHGVILVFLEIQDPPVLADLLDLKEILEVLDNQDLQGMLDRQDKRDCQEILVLKGIQDKLEHQDHQALKASLDQLELPG